MMALSSPKAVSVGKDGTPDGFEMTAGFITDVDPRGPTRLVIAVPPAYLERVHRDLVKALEPPLGVMYRQVVDRRNPQPQGATPRVYVSLEHRHDAVLAALAEGRDLVYHDARCEIRVRGDDGAQVVLDADGVLFAYPDDPTFRDVCKAWAIEERPIVTLHDRDYVKHWYHAENDALEDRFIERLGLVEMAARKA